jgi:hypothetical protein
MAKIPNRTLDLRIGDLALIQDYGAPGSRLRRQRFRAEFVKLCLMLRILTCVAKQQLVTGGGVAKPRASDMQRLGTPSSGKAYTQNRAVEFLNRTPNLSQLNLNAFVCAAPVYAEIGRFLLMLTAVLLITSPLTQRIWDWDHFLHGGQDFESGVLMILITLCLVLLLAQHCKQSVKLLIATCPLFSFICGDHLLARTAPGEAITAFRGERVPNPSSGIYNLPLLI